MMSRNNSNNNNNGRNGVYIVLNNIQAEEIAEKILNDLNTVNFDTCQKVNYLKARIVQILGHYRRGTVDEECLTISDTEIEEMRERTMRGVRKSVSGLFEKAKLDTNVIRLYDRAVAEEAKHKINRKVIDENLTLFKDKTKEELQKISDRTETLTSAVKSTVLDYLVDPNSGANGGVKFGVDFEKTDVNTKKMVAQTKNNIKQSVSSLLINVTRNITQGETEREKSLMENLLHFEEKLRDDVANQKEEVNQTIDNINCKVRNILPSKHSDEEN